MALTAPVGGSGESQFEEVPQGGPYIARCTRVLDLGHQETSFGPKQKIWMMWEIPSIRREWTDKDNVQQEGPASVSSRFTLSLHEKSNLRPLLEGWRGRAFTDEEASRFDIGSLVGVPCQMIVTHSPKEGGGVWVNIGAIMPLPPGMECPPQEGPSQFLELTQENYDAALFETLSERMQNTIKASPEWLTASGNMANPMAPPPADDVPF